MTLSATCLHSDTWNLYNQKFNPHICLGNNRNGKKIRLFYFDLMYPINYYMNQILSCQMARLFYGSEMLLIDFKTLGKTNNSLFQFCLSVCRSCTFDIWMSIQCFRNLFVTWSRGMSRMSLILILSYRPNEVTNSYVLHCLEI